MSRHRPAIVLTLGVAITLLAAAAVSAGPQAGPKLLRTQVVARYPHDAAAFTQGLVFHRGLLYESAGLYGQSDVRRVELKTGRVVRRWPLPSRFFAEGLAAVGERLIVLSWKENVAHVLDRRSFKLRSRLRYTGEGWGLCHDGKALVQSNGSSTLTFRDPVTFRAVRRVQVTLEGPAEGVLGLGAGPVDQLNELECVGTRVYANVWLTDRIVEIDARTGRVLAVIDAAGLLEEDERDDADVLNGIAALPDGKTFLLTGKLWPASFVVRFG